MARNKAPKEIRLRREQWRKEAKAQPPKRRWWAIPLQVLGALSAIAGILTFVPRIELQVTGSLDPSAPMKTVFSVDAQSLLPIHDAHAICDIGKIADKFGGGIYGIQFTFPESHADTLSPGQQMSLPCDRIVDMAATDQAKMTIDVTYRPSWVWWHRHVEFPVEAARASDGTWVWKRLPL
jgi:hypothetical protein